MPELPERNFCDGHEMKLTSALGEMQQAGAGAAAAESVTSCFYVCTCSWRLQTV